MLVKSDRLFKEQHGDRRLGNIHRIHDVSKLIMSGKRELIPEPSHPRHHHVLHGLNIELACTKAWGHNPISENKKSRYLINTSQITRSFLRRYHGPVCTCEREFRHIGIPRFYRVSLARGRALAQSQVCQPWSCGRGAFAHKQACRSKWIRPSSRRNERMIQQTKGKNKNGSRLVEKVPVS